METTWIIILLALIGVIAAIVAIIIPIILKRKKLMCILFPSLSLVDVRTEVKDKIKVYYNENLVENLSMMKVRIRNNGKLSIRKEDIVKPLEFNFGEDLSVIDYRVIDTEPKGITVNLEPNNGNNRIRCSFDLLNQGDELTLQFVCLGESKESPIIGARIDGIKQVDVETASVSEEIVKRRMKTLGNLYIYGGFLLLILSFIIYQIRGENLRFSSLNTVAVAIVTIILGFLAKKGYFPLKKYRRK